MVQEGTLNERSLNSQIKLTVYKGCGFILLGLAFLGVFLPLLPTTPLVLLALYCFKRGAPQWEEWVLDHPWLGPPVLRWRREKTIDPQVKIYAIALVTFSFGLSIWVLYPNPLYLLLALIWICLTTMLYRIKTTSVNEA